MEESLARLCLAGEAPDPQRLLDVMHVMQRLPRSQNGLSQKQRAASEAAGDGGRSQNQQVRHLGRRLQRWRIHDGDATKGRRKEGSSHKGWSEKSRRVWLDGITARQLPRALEISAAAPQRRSRTQTHNTTRNWQAAALS